MEDLPLKVVVDGTALGNEPSGAKVRFAALYGAAARRPGLDLTLLVREGLSLEGGPPEGARLVPVRRPAPPALRPFAVLNEALRRAAREKPDLFAAETLPLPARFPAPVAMTLHDLRFLDRRFASFGRRLYARTLLRRSLERAAAVVTVSKTTAGALRASGLYRRDALFVVPNAPPPVLPLSPRRAAAILGDLGVAEPYILCLGRMEPRKNHAALLDAFEAFSRRKGMGVTLVLAGSTAGPKGRKLLSRIAGPRASGGTVLAAGTVSEEEKNALFERAAAFVQPSLHEGFGIAILEAMNRGVPVACSSIPAHRETAGEAAMFFDPLDRADMARALEEILLEKTRARDLAAAGRERAARFSWKESARRLEEAWRRALTVR